MRTTLNAIRAHGPCADGWKKLLGNLGKSAADDEPISLLTILDSNGLDDAVWCLRAVTGHDKEIRLFAVWCARQVQHLMADQRSVNAIDTAESFANGTATAEDLTAASAAAWAAAWEAYSAAASAAACAAAWEEARAAAWEAASAAACAAAWEEARDDAWEEARAAQESKFREMVRDIEVAA